MKYFGADINEALICRKADILASEEYLDAGGIFLWTLMSGDTLYN